MIDISIAAQDVRISYAAIHADDASESKEDKAVDRQDRTISAYV